MAFCLFLTSQLSWCSRWKLKTSDRGFGSLPDATCNMLPFTLLQQSGHQPETKGRCCDAVCFFYEVYFLSLCIHAVCLFISLVCTVSTRGSLPLRNDFVYRANFHTCTVIHAALCDGKPLPKMGAITNRPDTCQTGA